MMDNFFKEILTNIDLPIGITNEKGEIIFCNTPFNKLTDAQKKELASKELSLENQKFILLTEKSSNTQAHQDFISTVSHELRTPLTSIRGFADTMLMSADKLSKDQQNKFLTIIRNQSDRLTRLVENLLEISNMSKNSKFIFKEIKFETFVIPIITIFEKKYPTRKYQVISDKNLPNIWADSDTLEQIMTNLLDNASKYSQDGSKVTIKAEYFQNSILIKIIDEAVKIPQNQLENIFNKFSRIDNPLTRKVEGSGLGLFITKTLTEKINGKIKAENYEKGNIFTLELHPSSIEEQLGSKISGEKI